MVAECVCAASAAELQAALAADRWDALIADLDAPGMDSEAVLGEVTTAHAGLPVILLAAPAEEARAVDLLRLGIWDVVCKDRPGRLLPSLRRALRAQTERELTLIASVFEMREGVMVTDRDNRILRVNRAFTEITGYAEAEVVGRNPSMLRSGRQGPEFYRDMWQALRRDGRWSGEILNRHKSGRIYPQWLSITVIDGADRGVSHYVAVMADLTQHKEAERALAANAAKSEFLANMSHEIRTPMNGVVGMTDILLETPLTPEQGRMVRTIRDSALSLLGILDDVLDFSKIEAGKLTLEAVPASLREVAEEVARLLVPNAGARDIDFHVYVDPALPQWVLADPLRLRQIMYNLLGNALKFTQGDAARRGRVALRVESPAGGGGTPAFRIRVIDNGIGIAPEAMGRLFRPFTQADESTSRRFGGTGLRLSITRRLVSLMQGSIEVRSAPGDGAEFTVTLPLQQAYAGHRLPELVSLQGLRVLAVVTDAMSAEVVQAYLRHAGAHVCVEADPDAAWERLRQPGPWSLLVLEASWAEWAGQDAAFASLPWVLLGRRGSPDETRPGPVSRCTRIRCSTGSWSMPLPSPAAGSPCRNWSTGASAAGIRATPRPPCSRPRRPAGWCWWRKTTRPTVKSSGSNCGCSATPRKPSGTAGVRWNAGAAVAMPCCSPTTTCPAWTVSG